MNTCQAWCGRRGVVPVPALRAVLCVSCDQAYSAWQNAHPHCLPCDWPAWNRRTVPATPPVPALADSQGQAERDRARDLLANLATRPLRPATRELLAIWAGIRKDLHA